MLLSQYYIILAAVFLSHFKPGQKQKKIISYNFCCFWLLICHIFFSSTVDCQYWSTIWITFNSIHFAHMTNERIFCAICEKPERGRERREKGLLRTCTWSHLEKQFMKLTKTFYDMRETTGQAKANETKNNNEANSPL